MTERVKTLDAKKYLQQVNKLNKLIENKMIEKEQWKSIATSTTAGGNATVKINGEQVALERVQSSGNPQKMADAVCKYVEIEKVIDECIDRYINMKAEVIRMIEQLPAVEYDILHKIYIQGKTLEDVADIYGKSYSWITTAHGRAIKGVQDMLDRREQV